MLNLKHSNDLESLLEIRKSLFNPPLLHGVVAINTPYSQGGLLQTLYS